MTENEPRVQIEFDHSADPSESAPGVVVESQEGGPWPVVVVAVILGGLLAGLLWLNSGADQPLADASEDSAAEVDEGLAEDGTEGEEEVDNASRIAIPASSSAAIAIEPVRLPGSAGASLFGEEIISLELVGDGGQVAPPVLRSADGVVWDEVETVAFSGADVSAVGYRWSGLRSVGAGFAISARSASGQSSSFVSTDAVEWVQVPVEAALTNVPVFFEPLSVADDFVIGLAQSRSEALAQFVEDHTTATNVEDACFFASQGVVSCDGNTEWPFTEATIDSAAGSEAVFSCFNLLSVLRSGVTLVRIDLREPETDPLELRIFPSTGLPQGLSDGRVVGIDAVNFFADPTACDGLATIDEVASERLFLFDAMSGSIDRIALSTAIIPESTEFLGQISVQETELLLFQAGFQLWTLDPATDSWTLLDDGAPSGRLVVADSGSRLYGFFVNDLTVVDLVADDGANGISLETTSVYIPLPSSALLGTVMEATEDRVMFRGQGSEWILDVPEEIRCIEQYAEALAGNGLVEDC